MPTTRIVAPANAKKGEILDDFVAQCAGAATQMVGSPTPPQKPPEGITTVSILGKLSISIIG